MNSVGSVLFKTVYINLKNKSGFSINIKDSVFRTKHCLQYLSSISFSASSGDYLKGKGSAYVDKMSV